MKVFLAGATGAIGRLLLPMMVNAGHEVTGTTRSSTKTASISAAGGRPVVVDALERDKLFDALAEAQPDVVIHMMTDLYSRDFAANSKLRIEGSRNLVDAAQAVHVNRMIAESIAWMYADGHAPATEDEPLDVNATESRGRAVAAVQALEQAVTEMPVGVILRFGILYGPGTWYSHDGLTTEQIKRGELAASDAVTSFVHVADAASAGFAALDWPAGCYNIVDDKPASAKEWLPFYAFLVGAPLTPFQNGAAAWERGASNAKARQLGWQPKVASWREGFAKELT